MRDREMDGFDDLERALRDELAVTPDPGVRARSRARILEAAVPASAPRRSPRRRRVVAPLTAAFVVLSATGVAAVPVSADALPGDALFGVRMATESIRIAIAGDEGAVRLSVARARTVDLERAIGAGRDRAVDEISRRFFEQLAAVRGLAAGDTSLRDGIAAQRARLDAIIAGVGDRIADKGRADVVIRDIRRHDDRDDGPASESDEDDGKPDDDDDPGDDREQDGDGDGTAGSIPPRESVDGSDEDRHEADPEGETDDDDDDRE